MISPDSIDYSAFDFKMALDWVEIEITLQAPTQPRHLLKHLPATWGPHAFVEPVGGHPSRSDTSFRFKVQDPVSAASVRRDLDALNVVKPFAQAPKITGIEVAFDAYSKTQDEQALIDMALHCLRCHATPVGPGRITSPGHFMAAADPREQRRAFTEGAATINVGDKGADLTQRGYPKCKDQQLPIPRDQHRARFEVTLRRTLVPFTTMDEWAAFDFTALAPHFKFRRIKTQAPQGSGLALMAARTAQLGGPAAPTTRNRRGAKYKAGTRADSDLGERARMALRRLTTAQRKRLPAA